MISLLFQHSFWNALFNFIAQKGRIQPVHFQ
jgi:hypothetical protein